MNYKQLELELREAIKEVVSLHDGGSWIDDHTAKHMAKSSMQVYVRSYEATKADGDIGFEQDADEQETGFEDTVIHVGDRVLESVRKSFSHLSFDYFLLIAPFRDEEQINFLKLVTTKNLSIFDFAKLIKEYKVVPGWEE